MDNASKGAIQAAEQYGAEQDEAEERARIADAHGLNVGEAGYMQLLIESNGFEKTLGDRLSYVLSISDEVEKVLHAVRIVGWLVGTGHLESNKEIDRIMKANSDEAKRDEGDPA